jgi:alpha/beta superfamily hydrolase
MEENCILQTQEYELEGLLDKKNRSQAVIITHPHPLYGGSMRNPVVEAIRTAYTNNGLTTLRFNFRGVGNSQGKFDTGHGEQEDVRAAITYLIELGIKTVNLAGYSFGAWVNASLNRNASAPVSEMIMVAPPVGFIDFGSIKAINCLKLVVTGSQDDIAPAELIRDVLPSWNPDARFEIIDGCDHFYDGYLTKLESILSSFLQKK